MNHIHFYRHGNSAALDFAAQELKQMGYLFCSKDDLENATHILLNIPSAQDFPMENVKTTTYIGGKLSLPHTANIIDLLKDPQYLAENAMITAHCAVKMVIGTLDCIITDCKILIIGWGRIGKCLTQILKQLGCSVTIAARKANDRAILNTLGVQAIDIQDIDPGSFDIIYNTVPELLIKDCTADATIIDLASTPGITGPNVIVARGLPGKVAPKSSGRLIAKTIHRILSSKERFI